MQIRNKKLKIIIYFISLFLFNLNLAAEEFNIVAKEILIDKENEILVGKGAVRAVDSEGQLINADKISLTGKKKHAKEYWSHSGFPGGSRVKTVKNSSPEFILYNSKISFKQ